LEEFDLTKREYAHIEVAGWQAMKSTQQAFTMIELMTVMAIIGVLAAIALPAYQTYSIRAQVAEGLGLTGPLTLAVASYRNNNGVYPSSNAEAALPPPDGYAGRFVESIGINGSVISILYGNDANTMISGQFVTLTASGTDGSVSWTCAGAGPISLSYLPPSCR
jgi:type IV pilus assembly protein PilA